LRSRYGVLILAVHRHGRNLRQNFANVRLQYGDTLLLEGTESGMARIQESRDFLMLQDVPPGMQRRSKQWVTGLTLLAVVVAASLQLMPISVLAVLGALVVVFSGCLEAEEAYAAIDWKVVLLIYGMLALGLALEKTEGVLMAAHWIIGAVGGWGPAVVLSTLLFIASLLTTFLSNNAVAVLLAPIAIQAALAIHVDPRPFLIAVAVGSSACFATPIGYQTNTLVYGAGGYMFRDFARVGVPLNLIFWILGSLLIPLLWPFEARPR
jgi:di/tricarboxylate transporter